MCARWKDPKRSPAACQKILDQYRKADGSALFLVNEFLVGPLVQLVDLHDEIPDAERVAIVRQALNAPSTENLLRQVTAGESAFLRKPKHPFTLVSQISTRYFSEMRHVAAKGVRHTFSRHLPPKFEQDEMIRQYSSYIHPGVKMPTDYSFVRTRVTERTAHSAANAAQHHLHLLLGLWNFHLFRPTATRWSSGLGPTPFAELRLGPIHTIHNATTGKPASSSFWFEDTYRRPFLSTRFQGKWQEVRDFERVARRRLGRLPFPARCRRKLHSLRKGARGSDLL